jgi:hypothetical protein
MTNLCMYLCVTNSKYETYDIAFSNKSDNTQIFVNIRGAYITLWPTSVCFITLVAELFCNHC